MIGHRAAKAAPPLVSAPSPPGSADLQADAPPSAVQSFQAQCQRPEAVLDPQHGGHLGHPVGRLGDVQGMQCGGPAGGAQPVIRPASRARPACTRRAGVVAQLGRRRGARWRSRSRRSPAAWPARPAPAVRGVRWAGPRTGRPRPQPHRRRRGPRRRASKGSGWSSGPTRLRCRAGSSSSNGGSRRGAGRSRNRWRPAPAARRRPRGRASSQRTGAADIVMRRPPAGWRRARTSRRVPGRSRFGSAPISCRLTAYQRGHSAWIAGCRRRRAQPAAGDRPERIAGPDRHPAGRRPWAAARVRCGMPRAWRAAGPESDGSAVAGLRRRLGRVRVGGPAEGRQHRRCRGRRRATGGRRPASAVAGLSRIDVPAAVTTTRRSAAGVTRSATRLTEPAEPAGQQRARRSAARPNATHRATSHSSAPARVATAASGPTSATQRRGDRSSPASCTGCGRQASEHVGRSEHRRPADTGMRISLVSLHLLSFTCIRYVTAIGQRRLWMRGRLRWPDCQCACRRVAKLGVHIPLGGI